jgi:RNA polymerase sigma-70 factor (ECF subfamily)
MGAKFATTQWSQVLAAREPTGTESQKALASLCEAYWYPLYAYVRSQGHDPEESRDLTQAYFAYLLEKNILEDVDPAAGRFRSFLLATLKHYVANERRKQGALKRGGGTQTISLDGEDAESRYGMEPADKLTPEQVFENRWALTVLERAMRCLEAEWGDGDRRKQFEQLRPHLTGQEPRIPFREVAAALEMTEVAVRGAMHRLRQRFGQLIRDEIAETVAKPDEVDDEVRHLLAVVGPWESDRK